MLVRTIVVLRAYHGCRAVDCCCGMVLAAYGRWRPYRTGDGDRRMSPHEIDRFIENRRRSARNDSTIVPGATVADLDQELVASWLRHARRSSFGRLDNMDDDSVFANMTGSRLQG